LTLSHSFHVDFCTTRLVVLESWGLSKLCYTSIIFNMALQHLFITYLLLDSMWAARPQQASLCTTSLMTKGIFISPSSNEAGSNYTMVDSLPLPTMATQPNCTDTTPQETLYYAKCLTLIWWVILHIWALSKNHLYLGNLVQEDHSHFQVAIHQVFQHEACHYPLL